MADITYKPKQFAKLIGKSVVTLQRWDRSGKLPAKRSSTNRRYYTQEQYLQVVGGHASTGGQVVAYCRSSCALSPNDLTIQQQELANYAGEHGWQIDQWYIDHNSSLNYQREQFNRLLTDIELGTVTTLLLAQPDRLVRFGYEWFASFCARHGTQIILVSPCPSLQDKRELLLELKLIINMFSTQLPELASVKPQLNQIIESLSL